MEPVERRPKIVLFRCEPVDAVAGEIDELLTPLALRPQRGNTPSDVALILLSGRVRRGARARTRGSSPASRSGRLARGRGSCRRARRASPARIADRLRCLEAPAAGEHREPGHELLLLSVEELVAPFDRRAQRLLALRAGPAHRPVRSASRCSSRSSRASGGRSFTRAAASSIASGRPSSRRQISATAPLDAKSGRTARARSANRAAASSSGNGGTGYCCSRVRRNGSRLVVSTLRLLESARSSASRGA